MRLITSKSLSKHVRAALKTQHWRADVHVAFHVAEEVPRIPLAEGLAGTTLSREALDANSENVTVRKLVVFRIVNEIRAQKHLASTVKKFLSGST